MVFHELDRISDLVGGHRIIIYYIEGEITNKVKLSQSVESVMEMLDKKNDDLIMFKVCQNTLQFKQFKELYKPEISGPIALFVINMEGIPLICEQIHNEDNIHDALDSLCRYCNLNAIPKSEITKVINCEIGKMSADKTNSEILRNGCQSKSNEEDCEMSLRGSSLDSDEDINGDSQDNSLSIFTVLQIRLPNGTKETQQFEKDAHLQEVYEFICNKFNLRDFDLKTFNRHVFSASDYERTLKDLDLTPNGVVIVVCKSVVSTNNYTISRKIQNGFWFIFAKTTSILYYIQGIIYAFWNNFFSSGRSTGTGTDTGTRPRQNQSRGSHSGIQGGHKNASVSVRRSLSRFGNIHTLKRNDESDDENNRYNGNSTQQK